MIRLQCYITGYGTRTNVYKFKTSSH